MGIAQLVKCRTEKNKRVKVSHIINGANLFCSCSKLKSEPPATYCVTMANCCRHTSIFHYRKLLQTYIARSLGQIDAGIHHCHYGKLLQAYITITMANCCKYSLLSLWQIAKNIHHCKYGKLLKTDHCNDGKLLTTYTTENMANCCKPVSLWQIAAYTYVTMANCWKYISL